MSNKDTLPPLPKDCIYAFSSGLPAAVMSAYYSGDQMRAYARAAIAAQAPALPVPGSQAASDAIDAMLREYDYPANPKNAARAGWNAARRFLAPLPLPVQAEPANLAHEIWAAAQLVPEEGIEDGVARIQALLAPAAQEPLHPTVMIDWLAARYRAAGGKEGITDLSAFCEEVMRWAEAKHGITGSAK